MEMRARSIFFWGALACAVITAMAFTGGWLWYDDEAMGWGQAHQIQGDTMEEGEWAENRYLSDTCLLLLKIVPASIVAAWFVVSWMVSGRDAFRLETLKSHFAALK